MTYYYHRCNVWMFCALRMVVCAALACSVSGNAQQQRAVVTQEPAIANLNACRPAYPQDAMRRGEQGVVSLQFTIGVTGRLIGSRVVTSSGFRDLDTAALIALAHCSFRPAFSKDKPIQASFTIAYRWSLAQQ